MDLLDDWLKGTDGEVQQIGFLVEFISWIADSDFLRLQLPEPTIVGDPTVPAAVEEQGVRGRSIYTSLFQHLDMRTFTCNFCGHVVEENLEDAITHQRTHFGHYPYQCLPNHTTWYVLPSFPWVRIKNAFSIQRATVRKSRGSGGAPAHLWTLVEATAMFYERWLPDRFSASK